MKFVLATGIVCLGCARLGVFGKGATIDLSRDTILASRYMNFLVATRVTHWGEFDDENMTVSVSRWRIRPFDINYGDRVETRRF